MDYFEENTNYSEEDINKILLLRNDVKNKILKNTQSVKEDEAIGMIIYFHKFTDEKYTLDKMLKCKKKTLIKFVNNYFRHGYDKWI